MVGYCLKVDSEGFYKVVKVKNGGDFLIDSAYKIARVLNNKQGRKKQMIGSYEGLTKIHKLDIGTKFHCINGDWNGEIIEIEGCKCLKILSVERVYPVSVEDELQIVILD